MTGFLRFFAVLVCGSWILKLSGTAVLSKKAIGPRLDRTLKHYSCICYVGPHKIKMNCRYCNEPWKKSDGRPQKQFTYSPIIPRLKAYVKNLEMVNHIKYRSNFVLDEGTIMDVFASKNYMCLNDEYVTIGGILQGHKFFSHKNDIALGPSLDGFCLF